MDPLVPQMVTQLAHGVPLDVQSVEPSRVVATMELGSDQHTPWGVVHGGAYATTVETVATLGASAAVLDRGQFAVGVNNNTDFIRPVVEGRLQVVAVAVQQGATQQLWQVEIRRADGKLVSRGQVRLQNVPLVKSGA
jgi:1,4-dihydroxy-2-naphthoyl-CoA hydrolase